MKKISSCLWCGSTYADIFILLHAVAQTYSLNVIYGSKYVVFYPKLKSHI